MIFFYSTSYQKTDGLKSPKDWIEFVMNDFKWEPFDARKQKTVIFYFFFKFSFYLVFYLSFFNSILWKSVGSAQNAQGYEK